MNDDGFESAVELLRQGELQTPAFVYDTRQIERELASARALLQGDATRLLFAMKSFSLAGGLRVLARRLDGLHASSLFEARLARRVLGDGGLVHLTSPCLPVKELPEIVELCDYLSFNSLSQWRQCRPAALGQTGCGLRVNPQLSLVADERYDPCRRHSKLGVPIEVLGDLWRDRPEQLAGIGGLLVHSNCDAEDLSPLLATVERLIDRLGGWIGRLEWVNLGGGYLFSQSDNPQALRQAIERLQACSGATLLFEPGAGLIRSAGYLVATVVDLFDSGGSRVAVLDTSVNHMPEVFEYQFQPDVVGDSDAGHDYLLAGATCLAGDVFGDYRFAEPLRVGSRVIFNNAGAYTTVKANLFNGVNLPSLYAVSEAGELVLDKHYSYQEFLQRCGAIF